MTTSPLTQPAPWCVPARPFEFRLQPGRAALVVIDMQRDFIEPGGFGASLGNDVSQLEAAIGPVQALLGLWRAQGWPVVHTRESHAPDLSDCPPAKRERGQPSLRIGDPGPMGRLLVRGEPGCDIVPAVAPWPGECVIDKPGKGAFYATALQAHLQSLGVTQLVVAGVTTEVCVQTTLREANDRGYDCLLVEEATASYFPAFKQAAIEMVVAQGGIVGWSARLNDLLHAAAAAAAPAAPAR
jgi:nicotinamidase-related amidase